MVNDSDMGFAADMMELSEEIHGLVADLEVDEFVFEGAERPVMMDDVRGDRREVIAVVGEGEKLSRGQRKRANKRKAEEEARRDVEAGRKMTEEVAGEREKRRA